MKTTIKQKDDYLVVYFEGRLDTAAAPQVQQEVKSLNDSTCEKIILDCSKLDYISSSGLRIFFGILKNAKPKGYHVYIRGINDDLRQIFSITGFINLFEYL